MLNSKQQAFVDALDKFGVKSHRPNQRVQAMGFFKAETFLFTARTLMVLGHRIGRFVQVSDAKLRYQLLKLKSLKTLRSGAMSYKIFNYGSQWFRKRT